MSSKDIEYLETKVLCGVSLAGADLQEADLRDAVLVDADLRDAALVGADLRCADLCRADLTGANLISADLSGAHLRRAGLSGAYLRGADLKEADLRRANLIGADLRGANLTGANLISADLIGADLRNSILGTANEERFKQGIWEIIAESPPEVPGLIKALKEGRIDGSVYEGECACLRGTLSKLSGKPITNRNVHHPAEQWFTLIGTGDKPTDDTGGGYAAAKALGWIVEWQKAVSI